MARKIYDKETKTGWKRIEGQWQYFDNGLVKLPGTDQIKFLKAATGAVYQAGVNTRSGLHNFVEQDKKLRTTQRQSKIQEYKDFGKAVSNFDVKKEFTEEGGRVVKNLGNAFSDMFKIGLGSGEFNDKGKEFSVFELRRQKEKYRKMEDNNTDDDLLSEEIDLPDIDYSVYTAEPTGDFTKMWEGVNLGNLNDPYSSVSFKNSMENTFWLTEGMLGATHSTTTKEKSLTAANLKNANPTALGGKPNELAIKTELGKNLRATNLGGTDPGQSLWLGENSTWSMGGNVVAPKVGTPEAEAMMNIPETPDATIAKEIVLDNPDVKVDSGLDVTADTSKLVDKSVNIESGTTDATPATGANPLPENFFSGMIDWLNNRGGK